MTAGARSWAEIRYEEVANGWETAPDAAKQDWLRELKKLVTDPTVRLRGEYRMKVNQLIQTIEAELRVPGS